MDSTASKQNSQVKPETVESLQSAIVLEKSAALKLLQQYTSYGSDSEDNDADEEKEEEAKKDESKITHKYRTMDVDTSSSSSSSESSEDELDLSQIRKKLETPPSDDEEDEEEGGGGNNTSKVKKKKEPLKVKGELLLEDLPPIQDLEIKVDERECLELGSISSIVDQLVLVEAYFNSAPLDIDSVLFLDKGQRVLGKVFDVIGQVASPIYCVRFNSHADIVEKSIAVGEKVFCAPRTEHTSFVILQNIMGKGSDASWKNDVEVPDNMIDYSDDEQEKSTKRRSKAVGRRHLPNQNEYSWHHNVRPGQQQNNHHPRHNFSQASNNSNQI